MNVVVSNELNIVIKTYVNVAPNYLVYFNRVYSQFDNESKEIKLNWCDLNSLIYILDVFFENSKEITDINPSSILEAFDYLEPNISKIFVLEKLNVCKYPDILRKLKLEEMIYYVSMIEPSSLLKKYYYDIDFKTKETTYELVKKICENCPNKFAKYINLEYFLKNLLESSVDYHKFSNLVEKNEINAVLCPLLSFIFCDGPKNYDYILKNVPKALIGEIDDILEKKLYHIIEDSKFRDMYDDLDNDQQNKIKNSLIFSKNAGYFLKAVDDFCVSNSIFFDNASGDKELATRILIDNPELFDSKEISEELVLMPPAKLDSSYRYSKSIIDIFEKQSIELSSNLFINCLLFCDISASECEVKLEVNLEDYHYEVSEEFFVRYTKSKIRNFIESCSDVEEWIKKEKFVFVKLGSFILTSDLFEKSNVLEQLYIDVTKLTPIENLEEIIVKYVGIQKGELIINDTHYLTVMSNTVISFLYQLENKYLVYFTDGTEEKIVLIIDNKLKIFNSEGMLSALLNKPLLLFKFVVCHCKLSTPCIRFLTKKHKTPVKKGKARGKVLKRNISEDSDYEF